MAAVLFVVAGVVLLQFSRIARTGPASGALPARFRYGDVDTETSPRP